MWAGKNRLPSTRAHARTRRLVKKLTKFAAQRTRPAVSWRHNLLKTVQQKTRYKAAKMLRLMTDRRRAAATKPSSRQLPKSKESLRSMNVSLLILLR